MIRPERREIGEMIGSYTEPAGDARYDGKAFRTGLPATSRGGEDTNTGTCSSTDSTGRGGSGYKAGATDVSTTGSTIGVTIIGKMETWRRTFSSSRSMTPEALDEPLEE